MGKKSPGYTMRRKEVSCKSTPKESDDQDDDDDDVRMEQLEVQASDIHIADNRTIDPRLLQVGVGGDNNAGRSGLGFLNQDQISHDYKETPPPSFNFATMGMEPDQPIGGSRTRAKTPCAKPKPIYRRTDRKREVEKISRDRVRQGFDRIGTSLDSLPEDYRQTFPGNETVEDVTRGGLLNTASYAIDDLSFIINELPHLKVTLIKRRQAAIAELAQIEDNSPM